MDNGRCLPHGAIDWRSHVQVRGHYDGRRVRLELARRHDILRRRRLLVGVPLLLHVRHVLGIAVRRSILLGVVVLCIGVVDG